MESIREIFKDKGFSEEEFSYLDNAINEFGEVFGEFVSREDLIERAKTTIDKIEFTEKLDSRSDCAIGCYDLKDKKIQVMNNLKDEELKSVFFHEFLHAIVSDGKNSGFMREYEIFDFYEGDYFVNLGRGWNEGFVQMMTQERDKKVTNKAISTGYPVLTETVNKFTNLMGRKELIDLYLNHSDRFVEFMEEFDCYGQGFLDNFDTIHNYEREILLKKSKRLLYNMFGGNINNKELEIAQEKIIQVYINALVKDRIESHTQLQDILNNISEMYNIVSKTISVQTIQRIIEQSNPEILSNLEGLDLETQVLVDSGIKFENYKKLDVSEKIKMLMEDEFVNSYLELESWYDSLTCEYRSSIIKELYHGRDFQNEDLSGYFWSFSAGIAPYIYENNLAFENLKIKYNDYISSGTIFELYNLQENGKYEKISTLFFDDDLDTKECTEVENKRLAELRDLISKEYSVEIAEAFEDKNGNYIVYDENGQAFVSTEFNEIERPSETISFESVNEIKLKNDEQIIANTTNRIKRLQNLEVPDTIIQHEREEIEKAMKDKERVLESIRNSTRKKVIPSQIEDKTINENVTIQSLQSAMEDLLTEEKNLENEGEELNVK